MFPWASSNSGYYEDSSAPQWTNKHHEVANYHLRNGIPHPDTHDKEDLVVWVNKVISGTFHKVDALSLASSFAALCFHFGEEEEKAKKAALEISHLLGNTSVFAKLCGNLWDKYVLHQKTESDPANLAIRQALNVARQQARR